MAPPFDPEFAKVFEPLLPALAAQGRPAVHDVQTRRATSKQVVAALVAHIPLSPDIEITVHHVKAQDGYLITVHEYRNKTAASSTPTSAVVHAHGGGMILADVETFKNVVAFQVEQTGVPFFSVDYRLAPEVSGTSLVDDCYAVLVWLSQNANRFNVDPARIAVAGESAGGGIAAGVALKARDEGLSPPLAKQILIYPMLDDRNNKPIKALEALHPVWGVDDNITGWTALLGKDKAGVPDADVPEYAAPARAKSVKGLPPTYIDVGTLDIFREEDLLYASRIAAENIEVELHLYPGLPHGFELIAFQSGIVQQAFRNRAKALLSIGIDNSGSPGQNVSPKI
jgi:acetyl esterase/lipase